MRFEYPNISLQMLDLDFVISQTLQTLAETLTRLELLGKWYRSTNAGGNQFPWSLEPELVHQNNRLPSYGCTRIR